MDEARGWHSRGYLPHFDGGETTQSVCFHLVDSIPRAVLTAWREAMRHLPSDEYVARRRRLAEAYLDRGRGPVWLADPTVAGLVRQALGQYAGHRYALHAWVVMPNHVHALFTPLAPFRLQRIVSGWKSYTANQANRHLGRAGAFWYPESYDRYIRTARHFANVVAYIEQNPVAAGLCARPEDWPWSSAALTPE